MMKLVKAVPREWGAAYASLLEATGLYDEKDADLTALLTTDAAEAAVAWEESNAHGQTSARGQTSAPGQTNALRQTDECGQTSALRPTNAPGQVDECGQTGAFGQTNAFRQTSAFGQTNAFKQTSAPGQTDEPGQTGERGPTNAFGQTDEPGQTDDPAAKMPTAFGQTDEPGPTADPALQTVDGEALVACGSLSGKVIKKIAVAPWAEGQDACARVVSALLTEAVGRGITAPFLFTKPQNRRMFTSLGFYPIVETEDMLMMHRAKNGLSAFLAALPRWEEGVTSCIVCNADPFTLGHRHLIATASAQSDHVLVFVLAEDKGFFPAADRLALVRAGTADLANVSVHSGGDWLISHATFPAYFIKDRQAAENARCDLDLTLFGQRIAPALNITRRFVGEEPFCQTTAQYNRRMVVILPKFGVSVTEIPRLNAISASTVRQLIKEGRLDETKPLLPESTYEYCKRKFR